MLHFLTIHLSILRTLSTFRLQNNTLASSFTLCSINFLNTYSDSCFEEGVRCNIQTLPANTEKSNVAILFCIVNVLVDILIKTESQNEMEIILSFIDSFFIL